MISGLFDADQPKRFPEISTLRNTGRAGQAASADRRTLDQKKMGLHRAIDHDLDIE